MQLEFPCFESLEIVYNSHRNSFIAFLLVYLFIKYEGA